MMLMQLKHYSTNRSEASRGHYCRFNFPQQPYYVLTVVSKYLPSRGCSFILINMPSKESSASLALGQFLLIPFQNLLWIPFRCPVLNFTPLLKPPSLSNLKFTSPFPQCLLFQLLYLYAIYSANVSTLVSSLISAK